MPGHLDCLAASPNFAAMLLVLLTSFCPPLLPNIDQDLEANHIILLCFVF